MSGEPDRDITVFREVYPGLRRFASAYARTSMDADDLVQEALTRTLRRGTLTELDDPRLYLMKAIVNVARNEQRRAVTAARSAEVDSAVSEAVYPSDLDFLRMLRPDDRAAILLIDVEGYSFSEVARTLGVSAVALRARVSRSRRALRNHLQGGDSDG